MAIATKTKPKSPGHKKRTGEHHKRSPRYMKTYWPYLPLLAIISLGLIINGVLTSQFRGIDGYATNVSPTSLLEYTNQQRQLQDQPELTINSKLSAAAQAKANDMVQKDYWSHVTPSGEQPWQFDTAAGYEYQSAGENLAYGFGDSAEILNAWMHSAEHRANILDKNYKNVGFGIANSPNFQGHGPATVVVAEYGQPLTPGVATSNTRPSKAAVTTSSEFSQPVERVQLMSGSLSYSVILVSLVAGLAALLFVLRHGLAFKRLFLEGEEFVLHHRYLDVLAVALVVAGILLTRTVGVIH